MKTYWFTGHLNPLTPGVRMPLQLSGQVCLPADAEAEIAALTAIHQREILAKNKLIDRLLKSIDNLNNLKRPPKRRVRRAPNGRENG